MFRLTCSSKELDLLVEVVKGKGKGFHADVQDESLEGSYIALTSSESNARFACVHLGRVLSYAAQFFFLIIR